MTPREEMDLQNRLRELESQSTDFWIGFIAGMIVVSGYFVARYFRWTT